MRIRGLIAISGAVLFGALVTFCGTPTQNFADAGPDASVLESGPPPTDGNPFGDVSTTDSSTPCGLKCQVVDCDGGEHTTISGTVYDPAGNNPLYNILVYIPTLPNVPLPAITHGMSCDACGTKISNAMATALTDAKGHFVINDAPVGTNIPLVVQVGKWRRQFTMSTVSACVDNPYPNSNTPADRLRLPAKKSEGDMPLIALATGCDPMDLLFKKIGIDPSEFTGANGTGMVHVYEGNNSDFDASTFTDAYAFWDNLTEMEKYDILINACECSPFPRNKGYANLDTYLNGGGRFFGSHFQVNFFGDPSAKSDLQNAAVWNEWGTGCGSGTYDIDTSFPKGQAMAAWLANIFPSDAGTSDAGMTQISIDCMTGDIQAAKNGLSQSWIYDDSNKFPAYISINTPTTVAPANRCGRAVLADMHVGTLDATLAQQEAALEFMFFDLAACVEDDGTNPEPPPPN